MLRRPNAHQIDPCGVERLMLADHLSSVGRGNRNGDHPAHEAARRSQNENGIERRSASSAAPSISSTYAPVSACKLNNTPATTNAHTIRRRYANASAASATGSATYVCVNPVE